MGYVCGERNPRVNALQQGFHTVFDGINAQGTAPDGAGNRTRGDSMITPNMRLYGISLWPKGNP